jgi:ribosomal protein S18 acetylase RimI-like enzyme
MAGMPTDADVFVVGSPAFETTVGFDGAVLASYQAEGSPLRSGYLLGEKYLNGKAAAVDVKLGDGHVVLLGFRPQWRGQPFGSFRVLFNAILR